MPKKSNPNKELMEQALKNRSFGKTIVDALDNLPKTKTAILINIQDLYSAPKKWNFYEPLDDNKKLELMESIQSNGVLSPIIVWKVEFDDVENEYHEDEIDEYNFQGNKYLILAGHNRADAINRLYLSTQDDEYLKIPAFIFESGELDINSAREIVIDTNYVQRSLSTKELVKSIMYKYVEVTKNKTKKGKVRDIVAEELGLSPTMVYNYMKLSTVIEPFQNMVYDNELNLTSVLKLVDKSQDIQEWIYNTYKGSITSKLLNKIKPYMKKTDIENLFEKELQPKIKTKKISTDVPEDLIDEFKEMAYQWIYNKTKRD